jgi:hypothetical protein
VTGHCGGVGPLQNESKDVQITAPGKGWWWYTLTDWHLIRKPWAALRREQQEQLESHHHENRAMGEKGEADHRRHKHNYIINKTAKMYFILEDTKYQQHYLKFIKLIGKAGFHFKCIRITLGKAHLWQRNIVQCEKVTHSCRVQRHFNNLQTSSFWSGSSLTLISINAKLKLLWK